MSRSLDAKIWAIAWPAILANLSIPLLGLVDAALLGHLDSPLYLGAVAVGGAVLSFLYWGFSFLRMGTTGEVARAAGAGDWRGSTLALARAAVLALLIAAALWLLRVPLLTLGLQLMGADRDISALAERYASLRLLSAPAVLLTYTVVGWCIGQQDTRWPMRIVIVTNGANIVFDAWFILGLGWASEGAALATVLAEYLGLGVAVLSLRHHRLQLDAALWKALLAWRPYLQLLSSNVNLFLRTAALLFTFAYFTAQGESLGPNTLAANAVMMQFLLFAAFALDGFAYAAEGMTGNALGAGDLPQFRRVVQRCALWSAVSALLISAVILLGRPWLFPLLSDLEEVQAVMRAHSLWLVLLPLAAAPSYLLDGVFIGAGATREMMLSMLLSVVLVYLPVWELARPWGNDGLWLAFTLFNASRGLTLGLAFTWFSRRDRWLARLADRPA